MKKIVTCLMVGIMALVFMPAGFLTQAHAEMSIDKGKRVFQSTWKVYYPDDTEHAWISTITDDDFFEMGSYTIDEMVLPDKWKFRITLHLDSTPNVFYWVYINEGVRGYSMKIDKAADGKWYRNVLAGWRSIKD